MINSVAINPSGKSIIGGYQGTDSNPTLYGAFIDLKGSLTPFSPSFTQKGAIRCVSLNSSGLGIIGGFLSEGEETPYAALVSQNGSLIPLKSLSLGGGSGRIHSVAIHDLGMAIIAGNHDESISYTALVAPDGTVTEIPTEGTIYAVCVVNGSAEPIFEELIPKSFGLGGAWADSLFSLSTTVLGRHLNATSLSPIDRGELSVVADSCEQIRWASCKEPSSTVWLSPFGLHARHKKDKVFPKLSHRSGGALLGFDYAKWERGLIGVAIGYASQNIHFSQTTTNGVGHQTWIALYGTRTSSFLEIEGALWGGMYQMNHRRTALGCMASHSRIKGTVWSPHLKVECPFQMKHMRLRPFAQWDWANLWQGPIRERGHAGMNLRINGQYVSLLRSEFGCALSQQLEGNGGTWHLRQKVSYIHKTPFRAKRVSAYYAGADATFGVSLFSNQIENFAGFCLESGFTPKKSALPFIGWAYQGEWGTKGLTHVLGLEVKKEF